MSNSGIKCPTSNKCIASNYLRWCIIGKNAFGDNSAHILITRDKAPVVGGRSELASSQELLTSYLLLCPSAWKPYSIAIALKESILVVIPVEELVDDRLFESLSALESIEFIESSIVLELTHLVTDSEALPPVSLPVLGVLSCLDTFEEKSCQMSTAVSLSIPRGIFYLLNRALLHETTLVDESEYRRLKFENRAAMRWP